MMTVIFVTTCVAVGFGIGHYIGYNAGARDGFRRARIAFTRDGDDYVPPHEKYVRKRTYRR